VEANVTLHEEHVEVMRRTISARRDLKDIVWSEQIIEVTEMVEQPVVNKTVRVAEEVVIRRKGSDHIETVHDTVRKQELEVERLPAETVERVSESEAPRIGSPVSGIGSDRGMPVRYKSIQGQEHDRTER
jgi:stress response protein YsnF